MTRGEEILQKHVTEAHSEVHPNEAIDPTLIITIIGMVFDFIKSCRNPGTAQSRIQNGGIITTFQARRALKASNYQGHVPSMARAMVAKGMAAPVEDIKAVVEDAQDVTTPPSVGGPWSLLLFLVAMLGFAGNAQAQFDLEPAQIEVVSGPWSLDSRVTKVEREVETLGSAIGQVADSLEKIDQRLARIESARPAANAPAPPSEAQPFLTDAEKLKMKVDRSEILLEKLANHILPESQVCDPDSIEKTPVQTVAEKLKAVPANKVPIQKAKVPVNSGITLNGRTLGDVNAYIAAHPAGHTGMTGNAELHLRQHGFGGALSSLSSHQKQKLHDIAHANGYPARTIYHQPDGGYSYSAVSMQSNSNCANGQCSKPASAGGYWKTGPFGLRTKWVSN